MLEFYYYYYCYYFENKWEPIALKELEFIIYRPCMIIVGNFKNKNKNQFQLGRANWHVVSVSKSKSE